MDESTAEVLISDAPIDGFEAETIDEDNLFAIEDEGTSSGMADLSAEDEEMNIEDGEEDEEDDGENPFDEEDEEDEENTAETDEPTKSLSSASAQVEANAAAQMLATKGINYNGLVDEFLNGGISDASLQALEEAGYPKEVIEAYIGGQQAKYEVHANKVFELAGGEEQYAKLCRWAAKHLSKDERDEFDAAVESMNLAKAQFAVKGLMARKQTATGKSAELVKAKTSKVTSGVKPFINADEIAFALEDPRYNVDRKYTKLVDARLMATSY